MRSTDLLAIGTNVVEIQSRLSLFPVFLLFMFYLYPFVEIICLCIRPREEGKEGENDKNCMFIE